MSNALPEILNNKPLATVNNMTIETAVLEPITINQKQAVFQIPMNGILDGGSFVQLAVKQATGASSYFPIMTGIHGLIESAFLKVGAKVVSSNADYAHYTTMIRQFETPEHRAYVDMVKSGCCGDRWGEFSGGGRLGLVDVDYGYGNFQLSVDNADAEAPRNIQPTDNDNH